MALSPSRSEWQVVATDIDTRFLDTIDESNLEVRPALIRTRLRTAQDGSGAQAGRMVAD